MCVWFCHSQFINSNKSQSHLKKRTSIEQILTLANRTYPEMGVAGSNLVARLKNILLNLTREYVNCKQNG